MKTKKARNQKHVAVGFEILNAMGDVLYNPWDYDDDGSLPEGFTEWSPEAVDEYQRDLAEVMGAAAVAALAELK